MGRFGRKYKNKLVKEQKKALNKIYKKQGMQGLLNSMGKYSHENAELIGTMDVAEQEGTEVQGPEERTEQETVSQEG
jgi:hypothetical protein